MPPLKFGIFDTCQYLCTPKIRTSMTKKKLGIVGCGKLSTIVADAVVQGILSEYEPVGAYSRTLASAEALVGRLAAGGHSCTACSTIDELLALRPDILVEAASPAALRVVALPALSAGISIVTLSIGALADDAFYDDVKRVAAASGAHLYVVSGATGGFDVLQTVTLMGGAKARFFNEKGPQALRGTEVFDDSLLTEQRVVFEGTATEAIAKFPTKVNVTVAASRASVGPANMHVTMQSTPGFKGDTQRVEIEGPQVHAVIDVYSATAEIAGWSVVNTLLNISAPIVFC